MYSSDWNARRRRCSELLVPASAWLFPLNPNGSCLRCRVRLRPIIFPLFSAIEFLAGFWKTLILPMMADHLGTKLGLISGCSPLFHHHTSRVSVQGCHQS